MRFVPTVALFVASGSLLSCGAASVDATLALRVPPQTVTFARTPTADAPIRFAGYAITDLALLHGAAPEAQRLTQGTRHAQWGYALRDSDGTQWWTQCWMDGVAGVRHVGFSGTWGTEIAFASSGFHCQSYRPDRVDSPTWELSVTGDGSASLIEASTLLGGIARRGDARAPGLEIRGSGRVWNLWESMKAEGRWQAAAPATSARAALDLGQTPTVRIDPTLTGDTRSAAALALAAGIVVSAGLRDNGLRGEDTSTSASPMAEQLANAIEHACARMHDGTVRCWQDDRVYNPGLTGVTNVSVGANYACATREDTRAICWPNPFARPTGSVLGDGATGSAYEAVPVFGPTGLVEVIASRYRTEHTCARASHGEVYCWGDNAEWIGGSPFTLPMLMPSATGASRVALYESEGRCASLIAVMPDGTVHVAHPSTKPACADEAFRDPINHASALHDVIDVATGRLFALVLLHDGKVLLWGERGMSMTNVAVTGAGDENTPRAVTALHHIVQIAAGSEHACALDNAGNLYCWGNNAWGQVGDASDGSHFGPGSNPAVVLSNVRQVVAAGSHTCALMHDGSVQCWGVRHNSESVRHPAIVDLTVRQH